MTTPYVPTPYKAPDEQPDNTAFWQAAREGRLLVRQCKSCGKPHWYPRTLCPFCMGDTEWKTASGQGTIPDLILAADEVIRLRAAMETVLARHTGQTTERLRRDTDRDRIFTPEQAVAYGLADEVLGG